MPKKRVLIADNCKDFVQLLCSYLKKQTDIEIVGVAYNGNQTIEMIKQTKPDVLLLDLIMPGLDGLSVLRKISENNYETEIYIISAVENDELQNIVKGYGVNRYFVKPINLKEVSIALSGKVF